MAELKYFFSYSRTDSDFVLKLARELREAGANVWLDQLDILGGEPFDEAIEKALRSCQGVIAVLSPASVASDHVRNEISFALEKKKPIIPVIMQECEVPIHLGSRQRIDFSASYEMGFSRLLKAIQIEQSRSPEAGKDGRQTRWQRLMGALNWFDISNAMREIFQTWQQRIKGALIGAFIWFCIGGFFALLIEYLKSQGNLVGPGPGMVPVGWIIPGVLSGTDKGKIKVAVIGCVIGCLVGCLFGAIHGAINADSPPLYAPRDNLRAYLMGEIIGLGYLGATLGAIGGALYWIKGVIKLITPVPRFSLRLPLSWKVPVCNL